MFVNTVILDIPEKKHYQYTCVKRKDVHYKKTKKECVLDDVIFNKPGTKEKAVENLKLLSGKKHFQNSGVCIYLNNECVWDYSEAVEMVMHNLTDQEIKNYVEIENPIHAAGAYKFESLGCNLFSHVNGSSYSVRGMPLIPLLSALRELQIISLK